MLPNVFPGAGETPDYNTADASLWFFEAWRAYIAATERCGVLRAAFPVLADMVAWHRQRHALRYRASIRRTGCCAPASPACS